MKRILWLPLLLLVIGCGSSSQEGEDPDINWDEPIWVILHAYSKNDEETKQAIDLTSLPLREVDGITMVLLSDLITYSTVIPKDSQQNWEVLTFWSTDGFDAASKSTCADVLPMPLKQLKKGRITLPDRNLIWDEYLQYPGCVHVTDCSDIILGMI